MKITYINAFVKKFDRLEKKQKQKVRDAIEVFTKNPQNPTLRNHKLKGKLDGKRAISAGYDLRIVFEEKGGYLEVIMIAVGKHEEVY